MPRPLPPFPQQSWAEPVVGPVLLELDKEDRFRDANAAASWTLPLLRERRAGRLNRQHVAAAQQWVMQSLGITDRSFQWGILAASDALGAVNTDRLTPECLRILIGSGRSLHREVMSGVVKDRAGLVKRVDAAKVQLRAACPLEWAPWTPYLDRVADALAAFLRS